MRRVNPRLREPLFVWLASIALTGAFGLIGLAVPFVQANLLGLVAATFLYLPIWTLDRRRIPLEAYGLTTRPLGRGLWHVLAVTLVVFPPYFVGHWAFETQVLGRTAALDPQRLSRFDRDLEGRPAALQPGLSVWTDETRLVVYYSPGGGPAPTLDVALAGPSGPVAVAGLRALALRPTGELVYAGRPPATVTVGATRFSPTAAGGIELSLGQADRLTLSRAGSMGAGAVRAGRYDVAMDLPVETSRSSWWWLLMLATQIVLVALPEEWFYRGYLQARLQEAFGQPWRVLGADLGWGWLLSSGLFALGHLVLDARPERLAVFFPSLLFGWLRARTGSVLASTLFHAICNVVAQVLGYLYV